MKFLAILGFVILSACSTTKCQSIDDKGKLRKAGDPVPAAETKTETASTATPVTTESTATQTALPAIANPGVNSGVSTVETPPPLNASEAALQAPTGVTDTGEPTVRVYKYDSSRQCGQSKGTSLEDMGKQLKDIRVYSQEKKSDGMMRIQMCGAPTGIANVYEIRQRDLKKAVRMGFREWKYSQQ